MAEEHTDTGGHAPPEPQGWMAVAAHLDEDDSVGRQLSADGAWTLRPGAQLMVRAGQSSDGAMQPVGEVRALVLAGRQMLAFGTLDHQPTAVGIATGRLLPEIGLGRDQQVQMPQSPDGGYRFTGGEIAYVLAGILPAWPHLAFALYDTWEQARDQLYRHMIDHPEHRLITGQQPRPDVDHVLLQVNAAAMALRSAGGALGATSFTAPALAPTEAQRLTDAAYSTAQLLRELVGGLRMRLREMHTAAVMARDADAVSVHRLLVQNVDVADGDLIRARDGLDIARGYAAKLYTL